jgi:hypothetical protein
MALFHRARIHRVVRKPCPGVLKLHARDHHEPVNDGMENWSRMTLFAWESRMIIASPQSSARRIAILADRALQRMTWHDDTMDNFQLENPGFLGPGEYHSSSSVFNQLQRVRKVCSAIRGSKSYHFPRFRELNVEAEAPIGGLSCGGYGGENPEQLHRYYFP